MLIKTYSRSRLILCMREREVSDLVATGRIKIISIRDSRISEPIFNSSPSVLNLAFDDIEPVREGVDEIYRESGQILFNEEHKDEIDLFLNRIDVDSQDLYVNCHAGISRSGSVALYAGYTLFQNMTMVMGTNPHINPNLYVLKKLGVLDEWKKHSDLT